ncbi:MAG: TRAP transporter substrate-binding protein [Caldisericia bacterium]|nr:TRAP transporter substrate-binding protein [Caldisericia bacterium]MDD5689093.1 TRAP transporter substrate-binding protein [Caldisericia bacterium]
MKKHIIFTIIFVIGLSLVLSIQTFAQEKYVFRLAHNNAIDHPVDQGAKYLANSIYEKTNGAIEIQVYPAAQLGDERQLGEGLQIGTIEMAFIASALLGQYSSEIKGLEGGYLFKDIEHWEKVTKSSIMEEISQILIDNIGVKLIGTGYAGTRHLTTTNKPIYHPGDLKGLLLRTPQVDTYSVVWEALGANVTGIAFNEVYMGLKMGIAEGQENPISSIYGMKFYEVQDYLIFTGHCISTNVFAMNYNKFNELPQEYQELILKEAQKAAEYAGSVYMEEETSLLPELEEYMTFIEVDKEEFMKAAQEGGMENWFIEQFGEELFNDIQNMK